MEIKKVDLSSGADKLTVSDLKKQTKKAKPKAKKKPTEKKPNPNQKYDPAIHPQLTVDYLSKGFPIRTLSTELKVSSHTISEWRKKYPEFEEACQEGRRGTEKFYVQTALDLAEGKKKGNAAALIFLMKNVCGYKDNPEEKQDKQPISIQFNLAKRPDNISEEDKTNEK